MVIANTQLFNVCNNKNSHIFTSRGTKMAIKTLLDGNSTFTASNNDTTVIGSNTGIQTVNVAAGVTGVIIDANIERFNFVGKISDYKFISVQGTGTQVQNSAGIVIATIPSLNQSLKIMDDFQCWYNTQPTDWLTLGTKSNVMAWGK